MAHVWVLTVRVEDETEGQDIVGLYTSLRKCKAAALDDAGRERWPRTERWVERFAGHHELVHVQTHRGTDPYTVAPETTTTTTTYMATRRRVM